jgi:hypothetical protein
MTLLGRFEGWDVGLGPIEPLINLVFLCYWTKYSYIRSLIYRGKKKNVGGECSGRQENLQEEKGACSFISTTLLEEISHVEQLGRSM